MEGIMQSKSRTFFACCFCFLLGVSIVSFVEFQLVLPYALWVVAVLALVIFIQKRYFRLLALLALSLFLGIIRYQIAIPSALPQYDVKTVFAGHVSAEPDVRLDGVRYIISRELEEGTQKIFLKSGLYPRYEYGDVLEVGCTLERPEPIEDFRYDMYLARFGVFATCSRPGLKKVGEGEGSVLLTQIFTIKNAVARKINILWPEPHASFMAGLLYGYRGGLGSLNELFAATGVTHIVAISGYNITIISTILISVCISLCIPRKKAFWLVVSGIALFVIFAGASASVVRAGIMGVIVLLARHLGRMSRVGNVLILTAVIMTAHNPYVLMWDAGFQLSFLSTVGLVYLTPIIEPWFVKVPEKLGFKESVMSTISATTITLPLILFQFGRLSIVAVVVNVLILWIIPFIMMTGFVAVLLSFVLQPLANIISWVAWFGMEYIIVIVEFFASLSFASVSMSVSFEVMIILYTLLLYAVYKKTNKKQLVLLGGGRVD